MRRVRRTSGYIVDVQKHCFWCMILGLRLAMLRVHGVKGNIVDSKAKHWRNGSLNLKMFVKRHN